MQHWKLYEIDTPDGSRSPVVLHSEDGESRVVLIALEPGQELSDHQVKEAALLLVVSRRGADRGRRRGGRRRRRASSSASTRTSGTAISSEGGARVLLTLAPWPGDGPLPRQHARGR